MPGVQGVLGVADLTVPTLALLGLAALTAGWVDAVVGGGGLIQLPALLIGLPQASPGQLLATNKMGSIVGTAGATATYLRRIRLDPRVSVSIAGCALLGSVGGAFVGMHVPKAAFEPIILVMLIAVGGYTLARPEQGTATQVRQEGRAATLRAGVIGTVIGAYDGALGPGTGSFLVFALVGWIGYSYLRGSATAKLGNLCTNLGALLVFVPAGLVLWPVALVIAPANLLGGYLGARTALRLGSRFVRVVFIVVVGAFILKIGLHDSGGTSMPPRSGGNLISALPAS